MKIPFIKMSGAGNDFIVLDRTAEAGPAAAIPSIPAACDRRRGVGADGLIILTAAADADFTMEYFNADGTGGSMCGNGARCAAWLAMGRLRKDEVSFRARGRVYSARRSPNGVTLELDNPGKARLNIRLQLGEVHLVGHFIDTGSPHLVIPADNPGPGREDVLDIGRKIRHHAEFAPSGTNVDFMTAMGRDEVKIRTYERGVEDETWACGTGAVAAAMVHSLLDGGEGERSVRVMPLSGEALYVGFRRSGDSFSAVTLEGPASVTFTGLYEVER